MLVKWPDFNTHPANGRSSFSFLLKSHSMNGWLRNLRGLPSTRSTCQLSSGSGIGNTRFARMSRLPQTGRVGSLYPTSERPLPHVVCLFGVHVSHESEGFKAASTLLRGACRQVSGRIRLRPVEQDALSALRRDMNFGPMLKLVKSPRLQQLSLCSPTKA